MPYELKATLSLQDNLSDKMKKAADSVDKFKASVREASRSLGAMAVAQQSLVTNYSQATRGVVNQNKDFVNSLNGQSRAMRSSQGEMQGMFKTMEEYQKQGLKTQSTLEKLDVANTKTANSIAANTEKANDKMILSEQIKSDKVAIEKARQNTIAEKGWWDAAKIEMSGINRVNDARAKGEEKRKSYTEKVNDDMVRDAELSEQRLSQIARQGEEVRKSIAEREASTSRLRDDNALRKEAAAVEKAHAAAIQEDARRTQQAAAAQEKLNNARSESISNGVGAGRDAGGNVLAAGGNILGLAGGAAAYMGGRSLLNGLKSSMAYEQGVANIRAISNKEDKNNFQMYQMQDGKKVDSDFSSLVKGISGNGIFTSQEVLEAAFVQAKAGTSYKDMQGGELKLALDLAQATDWIPSASAEMITQAKGAFKQDFAKLEKDAAARGESFNPNEYIANTIAGASNYSILDPVDFKSMIAMGGSVANQLGMTFQDMVMLGTGMSKGAGLVGGSDIGTSIKTLSQMVTNPTKPSIESMTKAGWYKDGKNQFYKDTPDGNRVIKSLDEMAKMVYSSTKDMTNEERGKIFDDVGGADAARAINGLYELGKDEKMMADMRKQLGVADVSKIAEERLDTAAAKLKILQNNWENMMITFFGETLGPLAGIFQSITKKMNSEGFKKGVAELGHQMSTGIQNWYDGLKDLDVGGKKWGDKDTPIMGKIVAAITDLFTRFTDWINSSPEGQALKDAISDAVAGFFKFILEAAWEGVKMFAEDAWNDFSAGKFADALVSSGVGALILNAITGGLAAVVAGAIATMTGKKIVDTIKSKKATDVDGKKPPTDKKPPKDKKPTTGTKGDSKSGGFFQNTWDATKDTANKVKDATVNTTKKVYNAASNVVSKTGNFVSDGFSKTTEYVKKGLSNLESSTATSLLKKLGLIGAAFEAYSFGENIMNGDTTAAAASKIITSMGEFAADVFADPLMEIGEAFGVLKEGTRVANEEARSSAWNAVAEFTGKHLDAGILGWGADEYTEFFKKLNPFADEEFVATLAPPPVDTGGATAAAQNAATAANQKSLEFANSLVQSFTSALLGGEAGAGIGTTSGGEVSGAITNRDSRIATAAKSALAAALAASPLPIFSFGGAIASFVSRVSASVRSSVTSQLGGSAPSKAGGENRVGADGLRYVHKDEAILTRGQANAWRNGGGTGGGGTQIVISGNSFGSIRSQDDIDAIAKSLAKEIQKAGGLMGE